MNSIKSFFCSAFLLCVSSTMAFAETIQFENVAPPGVWTELMTSFYEGDYEVSGDPFIIMSATSAIAPKIGPVSTSDFFAICACHTAISIQRIDLQPFTLNSIDVGIGSLAGVYGPYTLLMHGVGLGDDYSLTIEDGNWHTLSFAGDPNFSNLTYLEIGLPDGSIQTDAIAIDNINVSQVPVPAAAMLFSSALLTLGFARRKHA